MAQKIDYQKINSLKAKCMDKLLEIDKLTFAIQQLQKEAVELQKQWTEEEAKIKPAA